jgi:hypothetical protein
MVLNLKFRKKKRLPPKITKEVCLKLEYFIARFISGELLHYTEQDPDGVIFTAKVVKEVNRPLQLHIHLRLPKVNNETLDIDFYVSARELEKFVELREEAIRECKNLGIMYDASKVVQYVLPRSFKRKIKSMLEK